MFVQCFLNPSTRGYSESILKSKRHQLNETTKAVSHLWQKILTVPAIHFEHLLSLSCFGNVNGLRTILSIVTPTHHQELFSKTNGNPWFEVTPASQRLHFEKYNLWWGINAKKMKRSVRARLRWNEENWSKNVEHCCLCVWMLEEAMKQAGVCT